MTNKVLARSLAALGAAVVLGGTAVGVVGAQQPPTPTRTPGPAATAPATQAPGTREQAYNRLLDAVAAKLGVTGDRLRQAFDEARRELGVPERGPGGFGARRGGLGASLDVAATALGISVDQLRQDLAGRSLADVARARNVDPNRVATALKTDAATRIDQAVANGRLPADRAAQAKQDANTRIDQLMTQQVPADGRGLPGGRRGPGGPGGLGPQGTPGATSTPRP
jgi:hypothetical protein